MTRRSTRRHLAEMDALPDDWHAQYLYAERRLMRYALPWATLPALVGIPVGATHGVPVALAAVSGLVLAVAGPALAARWPTPQRWSAAVALTVLLFWPAVVCPGWAFFAGLYALFLLAVVVLALRPSYRRARRDGWLLVPPRSTTADR